jgi:hypothetical protein
MHGNDSSTHVVQCMPMMHRFSRLHLCTPFISIDLLSWRQVHLRHAHSHYSFISDSRSVCTAHGHAAIVTLAGLLSVYTLPVCLPAVVGFLFCGRSLVVSCVVSLPKSYCSIPVGITAQQCCITLLSKASAFQVRCWEAPCNLPSRRSVPWPAAYACFLIDWHIGADEGSTKQQATPPSECSPRTVIVANPGFHIETWAALKITTLPHETHKNDGLAPSRSLCTSLHHDMLQEHEV